MKRTLLRLGSLYALLVVVAVTIMLLEGVVFAKAIELAALAAALKAGVAKLGAVWGEP